MSHGYPFTLWPVMPLCAGGCGSDLYGVAERRPMAAVEGRAMRVTRGTRSPRPAIFGRASLLRDSLASRTRTGRLRVPVYDPRTPDSSPPRSGCRAGPGRGRYDLHRTGRQQSSRRKAEALHTRTQARSGPGTRCKTFSTVTSAPRNPRDPSRSAVSIFTSPEKRRFSTRIAVLRFWTEPCN